MKSAGTSQKSSASSRDEKSFSIRGQVVFGIVMMSAVLLGAGGWAATARLSGAVIAPGSIVVDSNVKKLQHRDGGTVSKIHVSNGNRVSAGQVLIELDDTQIRAELGVVQAQLTELGARAARLSAESDGLDEISFPASLSPSDPHTGKVLFGEQRLFVATRANMESQKDQLNAQIAQLNEEITGIIAQRDAKDGQLKIIALELSAVSKLFEQKLTSITRLYSLQREVKRLGGEHGGLVAQLARTKGRISEIKLQILSVAQTAALQARRELRTTQAKIAELAEREVAAKDRLKHTRLRAPQSGLVHELTAHTIGGVITPAETVLVIVPDNERLTVEVRIAPVDIDQVSIGRVANLRFTAFNQQTTPVVDGRVVHISADVTTDAKTSQSFYSARIELDAVARTTLGDLALLPGMPVEAYITTGTRTAMSYFSKPITDQFQRAFREN